MRIPEIRESLSFVPISVVTRFGDQKLSSGTGFFYAVKGSNVFITNWHIVSGRDPETLKPISPTGGIPDSLELKIPHREQIPGGPVATRWVSRVVPLYRDEGREQAVWYVHPEHLHRVDIAAICINELENASIRPANDASHDLDDLRLYPSLDVFVLGFPLGMSGGARFPIWKRGTIATEPDIDLEDLPKFYIDTATRKGMSGAPVYAQEVGTWLPMGVIDESKRILGKGRTFAGVYA